MDRDIEQAGDLVGRGDATRPDPAMIERATEAAVQALRARTTTPSSFYDDVRAAVEAAAGVIIPATAEHIATEIDVLAERTTDPSAKAAYLMTAAIARLFAAGLSAGTAGGGDGDE